MRGKKRDSEFISNFMLDCIKKEITSPEEMLTEASEKIKEIELKIKEVEELKILRSKLLDVVDTLNNNLEENKIYYHKTFDLPNENICKFICSKLESIETICLYSLFNKEHLSEDIIFSVKKLIENKIILKNGNYLNRGEQFFNYLRKDREITN